MRDLLWLRRSRAVSRTSVSPFKTAQVRPQSVRTATTMRQARVAAVPAGPADCRREPRHQTRRMAGVGDRRARSRDQRHHIDENGSRTGPTGRCTQVGRSRCGRAPM
jgi:hypothetical protein